MGFLQPGELSMQTKDLLHPKSTTFQFFKACGGIVEDTVPMTGYRIYDQQLGVRIKGNSYEKNTQHIIGT